MPAPPACVKRTLLFIIIVLYYKKFLFDREVQMRDRHIVCLDPGLVASFEAFLAHNEVSPEIRYVNAETLRKVVREAAGSDHDMAKRVIAKLEAEVIRGSPFVSSLALSQMVGKMYTDYDAPAFVPIAKAIQNVDKLPSISKRQLSTGRS